MKHSQDFQNTKDRALSAFSHLTDAEKKLLEVYLDASYSLGAHAEIRSVRQGLQAVEA